jgi:hypothetical protein
MSILINLSFSYTLWFLYSQWGKNKQTKTSYSMERILTRLEGLFRCGGEKENI